MYDLTRQEASEILNMSVRSIDRYIKSWKIRAKKDWKIVYLNRGDIHNLVSGEKKVAEVIIPKKQEKIIEEKNENQNNIYSWDDIRAANTKGIIKKSDFDKISSTFEKMFNDLRDENKQKDKLIQGLSMRLWKAEEVNKNSIPIIEYKKSQFLLEQSKISLNNEVFDIKKEKNDLEKKLDYEKNTNRLLIGFVIILFIVAGVIFFIKI
jgi:hypothetical protein